MLLTSSRCGITGPGETGVSTVPVVVVRGGGGGGGGGAACGGGGGIVCQGAGSRARGRRCLAAPAVIVRT